MMRFILCLAILSLALFSTSQAAESQPAAPQISDEVAAINYSLGYELGEKMTLYEMELRSEILWQGLVDALEQKEAPQISDQVAGSNYSLGYELGEKMTRYRLELRSEILWQGLSDSLQQKETPQLTPAERQAILARYAEQLQSPQKTAQQAPPEPPVQGFRLPGQEFLAWNAQQPGVQILPGGLQYLVLKEGSGEVPVAGDKVLVNYLAMDIDGNQFDSSAPQGIVAPVEFNVDKLMPGLSQALKIMPVGSTWRVFIPTSLAYRDTGPMAGKTVIYDLELLEILPEYQ